MCHAYQIVHKHGIPDENIIVMMYDDIANNKENPEKGQVIYEFKKIRLFGMAYKYRVAHSE